MVAARTALQSTQQPRPPRAAPRSAGSARSGHRSSCTLHTPALIFLDTLYTTYSPPYSTGGAQRGGPLLRTITTKTRDRYTSPAMRAILREEKIIRGTSHQKGCTPLHADILIILQSRARRISASPLARAPLLLLASRPMRRAILSLPMRATRRLHHCKHLLDVCSFAILPPPATDNASP